MMKSLSLKINSVHLLLCLFLTLLWVTTAAATTTASTATTAAATAAPAATETATEPPATTLATTKPAPDNVNDVTVVDQNKTSITLRWDKVKDIQTYRLQYNNNGIIITEDVNANDAAPQVVHVVSSLTDGTEYKFTLFTVSEGGSSTGFKFNAVTAPEDVNKVTVEDQNKTSITLEWDKVKGIKTYRLQYNNNGITTKDVNANDAAPQVVHAVSSLTDGTEYEFTVFTVFKGVNSTGHKFNAVTAPRNAEDFKSAGQNDTSITLQWNKVDKILNYTLVHGGQEINITAPEENEPVTHTISELTDGTEFNFILFTLFKNVRSSGVNTTAVTAPKDVQEVTVVDQNKTSITLRWDKVKGIQTYRLQYNNNGIITKDVNANDAAPQVEHVVSSLTDGTDYEFTLFTVFKGVNSTGHKFSALTAPKNVEIVMVTGQSETTIALKWDKVKNITTYRLQYDRNGIIIVEDVNATDRAAAVEHVVSSLIDANEYEFTLFTVFKTVNSTGHTFKAVTAPRNAEDFISAGQTETSITLQWKKVDKLLNYTLEYRGQEIKITAPEENETVTHTVSQLTNGTRYDFILFTLFKNVRSKGDTIQAVTAPVTVAEVIVTERSVTSITLQWKRVHGVGEYLLQINGENKPIPSILDPVTVTVPSLRAGTEYPFSLFSVFDRVHSAAYTGFTVTRINCADAAWRVTDSSIQGEIEGVFSNAIATNGSESHVSPGGSNVSFTGLYPGATYNVSLYYESNLGSFQQCQHNLTIIPPGLEARCEYWGGGYSILIRWNEPIGVWTGVEVNVSGNTRRVGENGELETHISGFQPAKVYQVSVASLSGNLRSKSYSFDCQTDPRGVIAGAVLGVLLFLLLLGVAFFIWRRKPLVFSRKNSFTRGTKLSSEEYKAIPVGLFPDHFYQMSADQNRGFSEEYENFIPVGTEQTRKAAGIPENKTKNRFTNVLPYDWSRVKLTTVDDTENSDYINANYMPGYCGNSQYIASQGPLPSTVNDFWRMIWEQKVKGVVMVTNCVEGGRTKCEQYWPLDYTPCLYGDLLVTVRSEQTQPNWTLREFGVKNRQTSEERTVKHFHFTAWPDHGVPEGTEALIQFRGLVREHMENEAGEAPTVVHCSAGVGRTGTIIALDVLLQQLERERAVGIAAFVHKMRLRRPLMVQTESQYIFLHQCIMNSLKPQQKIEENLYENSDMIYANATALQEFRSQNN